MTDIPKCIQPPTDEHWGCFELGVLEMELVWIVVYKSLYMFVYILTYSRFNLVLRSHEVVSYCLNRGIDSSGSTWEQQLPHNLSSSSSGVLSLCISHTNRKKMELHWGSIWANLMTSGIKERCPFGPSTHFYWVLFILLLSFKSSLHILGRLLYVVYYYIQVFFPSLWFFHFTFLSVNSEKI